MTNTEYIARLQTATTFDHRSKSRNGNKFWSKVDKTPGHGPKGDCWVWTGSRTPNGYGRMGLYTITQSSKSVSSATISWELLNGKVPKGKEIAHSCDNPPCVRPDHLRATTHRLNMREAFEKGRMLRKLKDGRRPERGLYVRLDKWQGEVLRKARNAKGFSIYEIAEMLQIHYSNYSLIENALRPIAFERLHFLLRFFNLSEEEIQLHKATISDYAKPFNRGGNKQNACRLKAA